MTTQELYNHSKSLGGLQDHKHNDKSSKTVCVSAVLAHFGIMPSQYQVTSTDKNVYAYEGVLRRFGFGVRSRASHFKKCKTIGQVRKAMRKVYGAEIESVAGYIVSVTYNNTYHLICLDTRGNTIVDTAPRDRDKRRVVKIRAIIKGDK